MERRWGVRCPFSLSAATVLCCSVLCCAVVLFCAELYRWDSYAEKPALCTTQRNDLSVIRGGATSKYKE